MTVLTSYKLYCGPDFPAPLEKKEKREKGKIRNISFLIVLTKGPIWKVSSMESTSYNGCIENLDCKFRKSFIEEIIAYEGFGKYIEVINF
ncbi:Schizosaccharomyces pombe specific protein [Schizosaccharomyces pombe]|uniref:Uncharacterized protein C5H10.07 n=1 Tax=Schizosaccharomyces pombe (strain 972 / ATCC 24843) TaxID=284812 RepID=YA07_SCHPO|nr:uncharacterized protein SPAC5H10.07 [Schizosaccharomyces pombe]Q09678.1 RecName: Full=Uncharacterized protein C5H10.07 [Schizosaccharomyces pombe 972h-]CAA89957.1 sequence orphan [Schizosaccharomyces pombe]|eukprot:NP_592820.1 uncharacterized protein SPAC5H10.07 [Schizosaccharomyces pombe]